MSGFGSEGPPVRNLESGGHIGYDQEAKVISLDIFRGPKKQKRNSFVDWWTGLELHRAMQIPLIALVLLMLVSSAVLYGAEYYKATAHLLLISFVSIALVWYLEYKKGTNYY